MLADAGPVHDMTDTGVTVHITHRYAAPPARVFDAWLTPSLASRWLFATASRPMIGAAMDVRNGGRFHLVERRAGARIIHRGRYLEVLRPRRLGFELHSPDVGVDRTRVLAEFLAFDQGCELRLTHHQLAAHCAAGVEARWTGMLYGLAQLLTRDRTEANQ